MLCDCQKQRNKDVELYQFYHLLEVLYFKFKTRKQNYRV